MERKNTESNMSTSEFPLQTIDGLSEVKPIRYVVVREGYRVSDVEYDDPNDPTCISEVQFWKRVVKKS
jgi:hypothetical protein